MNLSNLFELINELLRVNLVWAFVMSFIWGLISILLSPCHLSGIPLILLSFKKENTISRTIYIKFSIGLILSFVIALFTIYFFKGLLLSLSVSSELILAIVLIISGIQLLDLINFGFDLKYDQVNRDKFYAPLIIGLIFGLLIGPCTLAFAMPIVSFSGVLSDKLDIVTLSVLSLFSLGHMLGVVLIGFSIDRTTEWLRKKVFIDWMKKAVGVLLLFVGMVFIYRSTIV